MNLNKNSISAKLYRWFYTTRDMPQSLCPYFWKLVLMWVLIIPYTILSLPAILVELNEDSWESSTGYRPFMGVLTYGILIFLISMLSWVGLLFSEPTEGSIWWFMIIIGFTGWIAATVIGIAELFKWIKTKWENRKIKYDENGERIWHPVKERKDSIIITFIKAKYNKYCPKIDWK